MEKFSKLKGKQAFRDVAKRLFLLDGGRCREFHKKPVSKIEFGFQQSVCLARGQVGWLPEPGRQGRARQGRAGQRSAAQCSVVQFSTVQYGTVRYSTLQYSVV